MDMIAECEMDEQQGRMNYDGKRVTGPRGPKVNKLHSTVIFHLHDTDLYLHIPFTFQDILIVFIAVLLSSSGSITHSVF